MTTTVTVSPRTAVAARLCLAGGLIGAAQALILLLVPPVVGPDRFSYPLDATGHVVAQLTFAVQHLLLLAGVIALLRVAGPVSAMVRTALAAAVTGLGLLTVMELVALTAADAAVDDPFAVLVSALYSIPSVVIGLGLLVGGIGIVRARLWSGWRRWTPLVTGAYLFVVVLPGLMGPFWVGRVVLGLWMLLFAALGVTLLRSPR